MLLLCHSLPGIGGLAVASRDSPEPLRDLACRLQHSSRGSPGLSRLPVVAGAFAPPAGPPPFCLLHPAAYGTKTMCRWVMPGDLGLACYPETTSSKRAHTRPVTLRELAVSFPAGVRSRVPIPCWPQAYKWVLRIVVLLPLSETAG